MEDVVVDVDVDGDVVVDVDVDVGVDVDAVAIVESGRVTADGVIDGVATRGSVAAALAETGTADVPAVSEQAVVTASRTMKITDERWSLMAPL